MQHANIEAVRLVLLRLGRTSRQVAARLRTKGIRGEARVADDCPIAQYMRAVGLPWCIVNDYDIKFVHNGAIVAVELPAPVAAFRRGFDRGLYPQLLSGGDT